MSTPSTSLRDAPRSESPPIPPGLTSETLAHLPFRGSKVILSNNAALCDPMLSPLAVSASNSSSRIASPSSDDDENQTPSTASEDGSASSNDESLDSGLSETSSHGRSNAFPKSHSNESLSSVESTSQASSPKRTSSSSSLRASSRGRSVRKSNPPPSLSLSSSPSPAPSASASSSSSSSNSGASTLVSSILTPIVSHIANIAATPFSPCDKVDSMANMKASVPSASADVIVEDDAVGVSSATKLPVSFSSTTTTTTNPSSSTAIAPAVAALEGVVEGETALPDDPLAQSIAHFIDTNTAGNWLRYQEDKRTLIWAVIMPILSALHYIFPQYSLCILPFSLYFGLAAAVIAHNHNHCPTFTSDLANMLFGNWLSIFYGYPTYAWIPTHNLNHHRFVNRDGDYTITWRHTNEHNAAVASTYFFVSSYYQSDPIQDYMARAKASQHLNSKYKYILIQYAWFWSSHISLFALAAYLYGFAYGFKTYLMGFLLPAVFSLWAIMFVNYIQHVHCDAWDAYNHSRNFVSPTLNYLLFNNGYHTAHHNNASLHWSRLPQLHAQLEAKINIQLLVPSFWYFVFDSYVLSLFHSRFGTKQLGHAPYEDPALINNQSTSKPSAAVGDTKTVQRKTPARPLFDKLSERLKQA